MKNNGQIQVVSATIKGALHKAKGLPCQDYGCFKKTKDKVVAIVSDGAGSAKYSKIGAKVVCETLCDILINSNIDNIKNNVSAAIEVARQKLMLHKNNRTKSEAGLIDFSATLVGFFYHKNAGVLFHIGDGAGIAFSKGNYDDFIISEPENGAFLCETYFYTMQDWRSFLRFTKIENADRVLLMTDGVTCFVFSDDFYKIQRRFLVPVIEYLENEPRKTYAEKALCNTLADRKAQRINTDDKTLLWVKL
jgi:hypothetical protein